MAEVETQRLAGCVSGTMTTAELLNKDGPVTVKLERISHSEARREVVINARKKTKRSPAFRKHVPDRTKEAKADLARIFCPNTLYQFVFAKSRRNPEVLIGTLLPIFLI